MNTPVLIERPVRASIPQSGLLDGRQVIGAQPEPGVTIPATKRAPKPRVKKVPEQAPVPPPAPPMPKAKKASVKESPAVVPASEPEAAGKKRFEKGSEEAKAHMAKVRAAAKAKKAAIEAASKTPENSDADAVPKPAPKKRTLKPKKEAVASKPEDEFEA